LGENPDLQGKERLLSCCALDQACPEEGKGYKKLGTERHFNRSRVNAKKFAIKRESSGSEGSLEEGSRYSLWGGTAIKSGNGSNPPKGQPKQEKE